MRALLEQISFPRLKRWQFYATATLVAVAYFFSVFDLSFVTEGNFWYSREGDVGPHLIGYRYFVGDEWRFPLFHTQNLGYPQGTNIIFTDSIPAVALVSKMLVPILPDGFHPFGLWIFLCYLLLAHAFSALLYHFGHRSLLAAVAGALFAVMMPFFMERLLRQHAALCGQFLIVYALLLYFKVADDGKPRHSFARFTLLLVAALLVHGYLFAMVAAVYGCAVLNAAWQPDRSWRDLRLAMMTTILALAATVLAAGHLSRPVYSTDPLGFGHYSMNLLAPVASPHHGFLYYQFLDGTGGQYEGFNYWGAGIFLLLCASVPELLKKARSLFSLRLWPLLLGLLALTLYALSSEIYFGRHQILSYDFPLTWVSGQFRASGRFFWVVSYVAMALAVLGGLSIRRRWLSVTVLVAASGLQLADTASLRDSLRDAVLVPKQRLSEQERWRDIVKAHRLVVLLPPTQCGGSLREYSVIGRLAAESGVALHSVWAARQTKAALESCRTLNRDLLAYGLRPDVLYVADKRTALSFQQRPELRDSCGQLGDWTLCSIHRLTLDLAPLAPARVLPLWPSNQQRLGPAGFSEFLGIGWSYVESGGVWSVGYRSEMFFRMASCAEAASLRLRIVPFTGPEGQTLTVRANGGSPVTRSYRDRTVDELVVPIGRCNPAEPVVAVTVSVDQPMSALETGESRDARALGVHLIEVGLLR